MFVALSAFLVLGLTQTPDGLGGYTIVGRFWCGQPSTLRQAGTSYRYTEAELPASIVPLSDPARSIAFDAREVVYHFAGLHQKTSYKLRITCLSDSSVRIQSIYAGQWCLRSGIKLAQGEKLTTVLDLPKATYPSGYVSVMIVREAGPNAVVSSIEVWSTDPTPLPGKNVTATTDGHGTITVDVTNTIGGPVMAATVYVGDGDVLGTRGWTDKNGRLVLRLPAKWAQSTAELLYVIVNDVPAGGSTRVPVDDLFATDVGLTPMAKGNWSMSLDGAWRAAPYGRFSIVNNRPVLPPWRDVQVPGELAMQGVKVGSHWTELERSFRAPAAWAGRRLKLRFDAVYSRCQVYVNHVFAGRHMGGFTAFEFDVTSLVNLGCDNHVEVVLQNESIADTVASGTRYAAHPLAGITRKVTLFAVPQAHLTRLDVQTDVDPSLKAATLRVRLEASADGRAVGRRLRAELSLTGPDGKRAWPTPRLVDLGSTSGGSTVARTVAMAVPAVQLWDCEHPNLYTLSCRLMAQGQTETVARRIGFRQIEVRGNQLLVNYRPVKLRGACRHEADPLRGRSLTPELWRRDAELFREMNVNFIRTSHYPPAEEFIRACDELGILVEEEAPICWCNDDTAITRGPILRQTLEMVERDRNHPSVVMWSLANESGWNPSFAESSRVVRLADPTRPQIFSYGGVDIVSEHYPGPNRPAEVADSPKPVLFDEYCHLAVYNRREVVTDPGIRDGWGLGFASMWEKVYRSKGAIGGAIWAGIDDLFLLPDGSATGYGSWGPLDGWRREKPEFWHVKKAYSPIRVLKTALGVPSNGGTIEIPVENRHDFTNLQELRIEWELGPEKGTITADVPPRSRGILSLRPRETDLDGRQILLRFVSPRGDTLDTEAITLGQLHRPDPAQPRPGAARHVDATERTIEVSGTGWRWLIDRTTGAILLAEVGGKLVVNGGPTLLAISMEAGAVGPDYHADTPAWTPPCTEWRADKVEVEEDAGGTRITIHGRYREAVGSYVLSIDDAGTLVASYRFRHTEAFWPRQMGLVFDLARGCSTLAWRRNGQWTTYPPGHIGRLQGVARAFASERPQQEQRQRPTQPWSLDETSLGSNDFRATRRNVVWASLRSAGGYGVLARCGGRQHTRAWIDGDRVRLLVADFDNGGGDNSFGQHIEGLRRQEEAGSVIEGTVTLELVRP